MPAGAVLTFTDADVYHAAVRNAQVEGVVTARGDFRAELTRIDLHRLWMLRGEESLARIHNVAIGTRPAIWTDTDFSTVFAHFRLTTRDQLRKPNVIDGMHQQCRFCGGVISP